MSNNSDDNIKYSSLTSNKCYINEPSRLRIQNVKKIRDIKDNNNMQIDNDDINDIDDIGIRLISLDTILIGHIWNISIILRQYTQQVRNKRDRKKNDKEDNKKDDNKNG